MLSIGEFARLGGVSVRTLHHYEDVALLEPAYVNPKNGYRSYSAHQLPRLHRIIALKDLGLSLHHSFSNLAGLAASFPDELGHQLPCRPQGDPGGARLEVRVKCTGQEGVGSKDLGS